MATTYSYTIPGDFTNGYDPNFFTLQVNNDVTITTALLGANSNPSNVDVTFVSALSGPELTELNALVAAHNPANAPTIIKGNRWTFTDEKVVGTDGGSFASNTWIIRSLNTTFQTDPYDDTVSLASDQITVQPGTYKVEASAPAYRAGDHVIRVWNDTDSKEEAVGISAFTATSQANSTQSLTTLSTTLQFTDTKVLELQHQCTNTRNTNGRGRATGVGVEKYAFISFELVV